MLAFIPRGRPATPVTDRQPPADRAGMPAPPSAPIPSAPIPSAPIPAAPIPAAAVRAATAPGRAGPPRDWYVRAAVILAVVGTAVLVPAISDMTRGATASSVFQVFGAAVFFVLVAWLFFAPSRRGTAEPAPWPVPWVLLAAILGTGMALYVVGGISYLTVLALAAGACGRFTATIGPAAGAAASCGTAGLIVAALDNQGFGNIASAALVPPLAALFAYTAGKRIEAVTTLRQTQAELARVAVAEERLRIARDLHDLLGHSLSLITLKAELSRRLVAADAAGAEREMAELEAVARQSLTDVRAAVAGYRQPDLAAELGSARQMLAAAGIACQIAAPDALDLPAATAAVLAWTVREGVTNVVRHARASRVTIAIISGPGAVVAEIADNGCGQGPGPSGSGLAGLAERVRDLGGDLAAEPSRPSGFRLRVSIPAAVPAVAAAPSGSGDQ